MIPKILLFGKNGQIGSKLFRKLLCLGDVVALGSEDVDLTNHKAIRNAIKLHKPQFIVNSAAYTKVDDAEDNPDSAFAVNAYAVGVMAEEAKRLDAWLIHYSTDYVFDGSKDGPYTENDALAPVGVYARSKAAAEEMVQNSGCKHVIMRVSWVFSDTGQNFVKTILRAAETRDKLRVVGDQVGSPTSASLIADITALVMYRIISTSDSNLSGVYNAVSSGFVSWHQFACSIIEYAEKLGMPIKCKVTDIESITSAEYPIKAARPLNSRLDTSKIQNVFGIHMPSWEQYMMDVVDRL